MGRQVNKKEFASLIGKSERTVTNMIEDGMPHEGGGRGNPLSIDTAVAIEWMQRKAISKALGMEEGEEGLDKPDEGTKAYEEYHLLKAKREKEQIQVEELKKESIKLEELKPLMLKVASIYAQSNDAKSNRLASELADIDDPATIKRILLEESRSIRAATAERLRDFVRSTCEPVG